MNVITRNNIPFTWELAYIGLLKNWVSAADTLKDIDSAEFNKIDSETVSNLYVASEVSREAFLDIIRNIVDLTHYGMEDYIEVWAAAYLNDIFRSTVPVHQKLRDIANVWAMVSYPENWKEFIYYMPVKPGENSGEEDIYDKFKSYLKKQNERLNIDSEVE